MEGNDLDKYRFPKTLSEQNRIIGLPLMKLSPRGCFAVGIFHQEIFIQSDYCGSYLATDQGGETRKEFPLVIQLVLLVSAH